MLYQHSRVCAGKVPAEAALPILFSNIALGVLDPTDAPMVAFTD